MVGHPFDTLKVRLQVDGAAGARKYKGPLDCLIKTVRNEGVMALYKGVRSPLSGTPFIYACSFGGWGLGEYLLKEYVPSAIEPKTGGEAGETQLTVPGLFYIGVFSGFVQSFVYVPTELVKKRLMIQDNAKGDVGKLRYKGMIDCARRVVKEGGIRSLYVGFPLVLAGYMPAVGLWYGSYGYFRRKFSKKGEEKNPSPLVSIAAGGLAGVVGTLRAFGIVCVKGDKGGGAERYGDRLTVQDLDARSLRNLLPARPALGAAADGRGVQGPAPDHQAGVEERGPARVLQGLPAVLDAGVPGLCMAVEWMLDPPDDEGRHLFQRPLRGPFRFMTIAHELDMLEKVPGAGAWLNA